jgi:hypothetical protein
MSTATPPQRQESVSTLVDEFDQQGPREGGGGSGTPNWTKIRLIALGVLGVIIAVFVATRFMGERAASPGSESRIRVMIDAETGEVFENYRITEGAAGPWEHPTTGRKTLFQPEVCYWTRDGKAKLDPTYVLLNEFKGESGQTICPDCGRVVVAHNPLPPDELMIEAAEARKRSDR